MENEIVKVEEANKPQATDQVSEKQNIGNRIGTTIKEIISIFFWVYVPIKLFIFDIDQFLLITFLPTFAWTLNFKFVILILIIASLWVFTSSKQIFYWLSYILFYPVILFFWKIPFFILKQKSWILALAIINAIISFLKSLRYNFIMFALFISSSVIVLCFSNKYLMYYTVLTSSVVLIITYMNRLTYIFKPSKLSQMYSKIISSIRTKGVSSFALEQSIRDLPINSLDQKQLEKRTTNLQTSVLFNRLCLFVAKKMRDYQNSSVNVLFEIIAIIFLLVFTIFSFAIINYGLFKLNNNLFSFATPPTFFTFFYYSFNNILFNSINELMSILPISQTVSMIESFFSLFLVAIFLSLVLPRRLQKDSEELNEVITNVEAQGKEMEKFIKSEYKVDSIEDAMSELEKVQASLIKIIYQITKNT